MSSAQYSVTLANENVMRKGSNRQHLLMQTENNSLKVAQLHPCMISEVMFKHLLLGVCKIIAENNFLTVYSLSGGGSCLWYETALWFPYLSFTPELMKLCCHELLVENQCVKRVPSEHVGGNLPASHRSRRSFGVLKNQV